MRDNKQNQFLARSRTFVILAVAAFSLSPLISEADSGALSGREIYRRCYARLVRAIPKDDDPRTPAPGSQAAAGVDACMTLLNSAKFMRATGTLPSPTNIEAVEIVRTIHSWHRSWFQAHIPSLTNALIRSTTTLVHDFEEPALYYTRAAFLENEPFNSVTTLNSAVKGVRHRPGVNPEPLLDAQSIMTFTGTRAPWKTANGVLISYHPTGEKTVGGEIAQTNLLAPPSALAQFGSLIGTRAAASLVFPYFFRFSLVPYFVEHGYTAGSPARAQMESALESAVRNADPTAHFGGGVLGSQSFIMANANLEPNTIPFDEQAINRRLTARIFQDLLCHDLPALKAEDVEADINARSQYTFRRNATCMRCHSSVDTAAMAYRNIFTGVSLGNVPPGTEIGTALAAAVRLPASSSSTAAFPLQPSTGALRLREHFTENLITRPVNGPGGLGAEIANLQDLYSCAAKRYYKALTGIDVPLRRLLQDSPTYESDQAQQEVVSRLAQTLRSSQNVKTLLREIFSSAAFQRRDYGIAPAERGSP